MGHRGSGLSESSTTPPKDGLPPRPNPQAAAEALLGRKPANPRSAGLPYASPNTGQEPTVNSGVDLPATPRSKPTPPFPFGQSIPSKAGNADSSPQASLTDLPAPSERTANRARSNPSEADLPAPVARPAKPVGGVFAPKGDSNRHLDDTVRYDLDLPAAKGARKPAAPQPQSASGAAPQSAFGDLPTPKTTAHKSAALSSAFGEVDLPAPRTGTPVTPASSSLATTHDADLPAPKSASSHFSGDADLPAPLGHGGTAAELPALKAPPSEADLPAVKGRERSGADDIDLPQPKASVAPPKAIALGPDVSAARTDHAGIDLPAPRADNVADSSLSDFGDIDLPGLQLDFEDSTPRGFREDPLTADLDLPEVAASTPGFGEPDLEVPEFQPSAVDFPAKRAAVPEVPAALRADDVGLPQVQGAVDLPISQGSSDLPLPKQTSDLPLPTPNSAPQPQGVTDLPVSSGEFGMLDLPLPADGPFAEDDFNDPADATALQLPTPLATSELLNAGGQTAIGLGPHPTPLNGNSDSELPPSLLGDDEADFSGLTLDENVPPVPGPFTPEGSMLPEPIGMFDELSEEADQEGPTRIAPAGYGEVVLDRDSAVSTPNDEEMEFGIDDDELDGRNFSLPPEMLRRRRAEESAQEEKRGPRAAIVLGSVFGLLALVGVVGVGLGMFTHYGYFGMYFLEQYSSQAGTPQFASEAIERAETVMLSDTYADSRQGLRLLGDARRNAGLNRRLLARSLMHESFSLVRFGEGATSTAHAAAILRRLNERGGQAAGMDLSRAADAARRGQWQEATSHLTQARREAPKDPYVELLAGEIALAEGKAAEAKNAFAAALSKGAKARAHWGSARAAALASNWSEHDQAVEQTLALSPRHAEAHIAAAKAAFRRGELDETIAGLRIATGQRAVEDIFLWAAPATRAGGFSALGFAQEAKGQLHLARRAYDTALRIDANRVEALIGAGRVMLRERRFSDALARFETAAGAAKRGDNPLMMSGRAAAVEADLGRARAMMALDRAPDAKAVMEDLFKRKPEDAEVADLLGHAEEALKNEERAEELYRTSMKLAPATFRGYLSLSQLFGRQGRADLASEVLNDATNHVPETAEMRRMLGQAELSRNRLGAALHEFDRALSLDPADMEASFGRGQALRRDGRLPEATEVFRQIAQRDESFPGLALERGLLQEAQGDFSAAITLYEAALSRQEGNLQLLLRLGAAQVEAGQLDGAEKTLERVVRDMPNSAEAEYFVGRIAFARGRTPDALTHFDRALSLDGTQGEIRLYAGRAALEMGNFGRALEEVEAALSRDPSLGDSYWVRGTVRLRMGAVQDALRDLRRAIALNPSRTEAHAAMAECYEQMGQLQTAATAWEAALKAEPGKGQWWYRLAQLQLDRGQRKEAAELVQKALAHVTNAPSGEPERWVADAERIAGDIAKSQQQREEAIGHYKRYLSIAPHSHLDRKSIEQQLRRWGVELPEPSP